MHLRKISASNEADAPIASLISKMTKARRRVKPGGWQYRMLADNLAALQIAQACMSPSADDARLIASDELRQALAALATMIVRAEKAQAGLAPGSSPHTLQRNRLAALRIAEAMTTTELSRRPV